MNYVRNHWQGGQSLLWSLWINLVLIRTVILFSDRFALPPYIPIRSDAIVATVVFCLLCHGIIYPWQIVGLLRAIKRQEGGINSDTAAWIAYLAIAGSLVFTLLSLLVSYQSLTADKFVVEDPLALEKARASQYTLRVSPNGRQIHISGSLALGSGDKLSDLLDQNRAVTDIVLRSDGGHVYAGRRIAYLINSRLLNTYVYGSCKSACATAFIGGAKRHLGRAAKLGFHQYGIDLRFPLPLYDLEAEQEKEIRFYRLQGISEDFLGRVFKSSHQEIWFPTHKELLNAGVIHDIVEE
ncbi:MAG: hypothetical protein HOK21_08095 [Rhodospirillaceae bacterium]|jgi:hypothetical protein|nr:hypothetical protein [Rhodospirillaceae bacterium]MBT5524030.1 hypothetical protein [Rhodospirillaceae bacterium]MBT5882507.1 hypothetical protein [Rhodospirillaceae bacterium]MBT6910305.1 hypothetical protein [Rhodospirillaceae bacterium]